jgi:hypothetical protein
MIIGLSGYARSGKDTVGKRLVDNHEFLNYAFANFIKDLLFYMNPIIDDKEFRLFDVVKAYGWEVAKTKFPEVRRLLQVLGVGARNTFRDTFWIDELVRTIPSDRNIVITDVRFKNEADRIKELGGQIWRIERSGVSAVNDHISEHDLDNWEFDAYIHNNSSLEDLYFAVDTTLRARV